MGIEGDATAGAAYAEHSVVVMGCRTEANIYEVFSAVRGARVGDKGVEVRQVGGQVGVNAVQEKLSGVMKSGAVKDKVRQASLDRVRVSVAEGAGFWVTGLAAESTGAD